MTSALEESLQEGITAHKNGRLQDAKHIYRTILKSKPRHPHANHNLGVLAVTLNQVEAALPLFATALQENPSNEQFWVSYIDALIKADRFDSASYSLRQAKKRNISDQRLTAFEKNLASKHIAEGESSLSPSPEILKELVLHYQKGLLEVAEILALLITEKFPEHQLGWKILGAILLQTGRFRESLEPMERSAFLDRKDPEAHINLGNTLHKLGDYVGAIESYNAAIELNQEIPAAYFNLGNSLKEIYRTEEAQESFEKAVSLDPNFTDVCWNLHGTQTNIDDALYWLDQCLSADENYTRAKLMAAVLKSYQGDSRSYNELKNTDLCQHPYMRTFAWVFSLTKLPELYFDRWRFFDAVVTKSIATRPFYEFGVWRASSFRYLIKTFKKGFGFDTFTGLPEEWDLKSHVEPRGKYSNDGIIPNVPGGEFIVGEFEDTLPKFFSKVRPVASIINFDADLYSSTLCALNYSKTVIDKNTVLIFDEFIINETWEQDEFKALNEFCSSNNFTYEVIALSFFTKQVAVRLHAI